MVTYRLATENDYRNINNFHNRIYEKNRTMNEFLWEFHNCPFGKAIYVLATDEDRIVGTNCVIPIVLTNSKGELFLTGKSEDTLVDPEYRGRNIFQNIYDYLLNECSKNGIEIIWGYTPAVKPFQKIGFHVPFEHQQSLLVNDIVASYAYLSGLNPKNRLKQKLQIFIFCILSKLKDMKGRIKFKESRFTIRRDQNLTEQVVELIGKSSMSNPELFYINQSKEFQQWRIYDNPNYFKVRTFVAYDLDERIRALIVLNTDPNGVAYVIHSTFDSSISVKEKVSILRYTSRTLFKEGIKLIRNWHFDHNSVNCGEIEVYEKANFMMLRKGISFVWKEIGTSRLSPSNFVLSRVSTQGVV